jgi:hypothetical protein
VIGLRGVLVTVAVEALLTYGLTKLVGTPVVWSALIALPLAILLLLLLSTPPGVEPVWAPPPSPPAVAAHLDASMLAGRLEDAAADQGRYTNRVQPRLAGLALTALRRRSGLTDVVDLADPRAAVALGAHWHAVLTDPSATLPPPDELLALLARLEEQ